MALIKSTIATDRVAEVEFPTISGFIINLRYITREELTKIRTNSIVYKYSKRTHTKEEEVNNDKFLEQYAEKVIAGWKGLKVKHLPSLYPANISKLNSEEDVPYSKEDALELLKVSTEFDAFITDAMGSLDTFEEERKEIEEKN